MTKAQPSTPPDVTAADGAIACRDLRYSFGSHVAVDGITFDVARGEVFGLLGPNGAGKTTAIRILTTLLPVDPGHAFVVGLDVARDAMQVRRRLGYVPQQLSADGSLSGRENVELFARLFDVPRADRRRRTSEVLEIMGLADASEQLAGTYSGGMVRRLELAQALINQPEVVILDEPTIGLDPVGRSGVWDRIRELRDAGLTVMITTHYMEEAEALCDRVALMHQGTIRASGTTGELMRAVSPDATLEDAFRHFVGDVDAEGGDLRDIRSTRRTAGRLG
jgi:ABC-2 type transport system ATP-binding protein